MTNKPNTSVTKPTSSVSELPRRLFVNGGSFARQFEENPAEASSWSGKKWSNLVAARPEVADKCPWEKLDGLNWSLVLKYQPQFADKCPWNLLDGFDWSSLLALQPQFADKCDWSKLGWADWERLLKEQPQFADKKPKDLKKPSKPSPAAGSLSYVSKDVLAKVENGKVVSVQFLDKRTR